MIRSKPPARSSSTLTPKKPKAPKKRPPATTSVVDTFGGNDALLAEMVELFETARHTAARSINAIMTATYWEFGRRFIEEEQGGHSRAEYGQELLVRFADGLTARFGRGFSRQNLQQMRCFYLAYPLEKIRQTLSGESGNRNAVTGTCG